jgi:hypothetical protein
MQGRTSLIGALAVVALAFSFGGAAALDIKVGLSVAVAPPPVILAPPPLVVVPGTRVQHVPSASFNLFVHGGRYYSFHNGAWFVAAGHGTPWAAIAIASVPAPIRAVPVTHYKIPPGHARKKMKAHEGGWCPPGQAKKGRC